MLSSRSSAIPIVAVPASSLRNSSESGSFTICRSLCEAASSLGCDFHAAHPGIPWGEMVAMRNALVHDYGGVDADEVWRTVERDLPPLKQQLICLAGELGSTE